MHYIFAVLFYISLFITVREAIYFVSLVAIRLRRNEGSVTGINVLAVFITLTVLFGNLM